MKSIDLNKLDQLNGKQIGINDTFSFQCNEEVSCFNKCCRNLNLFLYPYDIIRLKKNLGITSNEFIEKYLDLILRPLNFFPDVLLRMSDNEEKTCPFLDNNGCTYVGDITGLDVINLYSSTSSNPFYGKIKQLYTGAYPTDLQMQQMTT